METSSITKASVRQKIWNYLEVNNLANFPRPVHHRIPNFKGSNAAAEKVTMMDVFKKARTIKVNPDKPQEWARYKALEERKILLVPTPKLRQGLFNKIVPPDKSNTDMLKRCATREGITKYSVPIGLDCKLAIDLIVIGSVAVTRSGLRIGKGEGYADMEYAMMVTMGAVNDGTVVVTTVHDSQVIDDIPDSLFGDHDISVDFIVTPTQVIKCENRKPKPTGIIWALLTPEKLQEIPILKTLRDKERRMGKNVSLKPVT